MKKDFEQMATDAPKIALTAEEKEQMRGVLTTFIEKNPVRVRSGFRLMWWRLTAPFISLYRKPMPFIALIIVLVMGAGTTYAAESSLPGDLLYPVKVNVTENVRGFVALSDESKADWEVERASRRLDEVEALQLKGTLDAAVRAEVVARFAALAERAEDKIDALKAAGKVELAAELTERFEENLKARQEKIERHRAEDKAFGSVDTAADVEVDTLINNVRARVDILEKRHERREERQDRREERREERREDRQENRQENRHEDRAEVRARGDFDATAENRVDVEGSLRREDRRARIEERNEKRLRVDLPL